MRNKLLVGQFVERDSILHRLDPRTKLLGIIVGMIVMLIIRSGIGYAAAAIAVVGVMLLSRVPIPLYVRGLLSLLPILLFTLLYHILFGRGEDVIFSFRVVTVTQEGVTEGLRVFVRIVLMILLASTLTASTRPLLLAQGLERLLKPLSKLKVPVEQFALMVVIAIRFIPTVLDEFNRIQLARQARGFEPAQRNPVRRALSFVPVLVPLLVTTVRRADNLTMAIDARAYGDGRNRTVYRPLVLGKTDFMSGSILLISAALTLWLDMRFGR